MNINTFYRLSIGLLCILLSLNSFADANYSISDSNHPWFPLTRAKWKMVSIQYPSGPKQTTLKNGFDVKKIILSIRRGHIGFHLGCNGHGAKLKLLANNELDSETMTFTLRGCKQQAEVADKEIAKLLRNVSRFRTNESNMQPTLALQIKDGTRLYFRGEPIPDAIYGEPKVRRIELKQRKKANCTKQGCREWREVFVNNKGAITHKSKWRYNPPEIRDFKAKPNTWYSLGIKEFNTQSGLVWYVKYRGSSANLAHVEGRVK